MDPRTLGATRTGGTTMFATYFILFLSAVAGKLASNHNQTLLRG